MAGGPAVPLLPGRRDCNNCFDNSTVLPDECFTLDELTNFWGEAFIPPSFQKSSQRKRVKDRPSFQ